MSDVKMGGLQLRGQTLPVIECGSGDSILYLHGTLGNPGVPAIIDQMAATNRVVAPTLPGFFGTVANDNLRTLYDWVVALSELVDLAGLAGRPVVASSVNAMLALELAAVRPEAFSHLILVGPLGLWDSKEPVADLFSQMQSREAKLLVANPELLAPIYSSDIGSDGSAAIERTVNRYIARTTCASLVWPLPEFGLSDRLHRVTSPVTLVWGADDKYVPSSYAKRFEAQLPNVRSIEMIDGAGHLADLDNPEAVAAIVAAALTGARNVEAVA